MNASIGRISFLSLVICISACAGAKVSDETQSAPAGTASRPSQIVIYPFAVDANDVTLNQSIVQRAYRNMSGANQNASQEKIATDTASNVCLSVAANLTAKGYKAVCLQRGTPAGGENPLIVDGEFTDISEGNRLRRLVIGFGAGASTLDAAVHIYQRTEAGSAPLIDFSTHADSGKMPGAAIMGPAGAVAGGSAAVVVGANAAVGGAKTYTSATSYLADKTATQITDVITKYYEQQGWTAS
jgi:hypothetical protein